MVDLFKLYRDIKFYNREDLSPIHTRDLEALNEPISPPRTYIYLNPPKRHLFDQELFKTYTLSSYLTWEYGIDTEIRKEKSHADPDQPLNRLSGLMRLRNAVDKPRWKLCELFGGFFTLVQDPAYGAIRYEDVRKELVFEVSSSARSISAP